MNLIGQANHRNLHNFQPFRKTKIYMTDSPRNEVVKSADSYYDAKCTM
jgi:hypothetical protein